MFALTPFRHIVSRQPRRASLMDTDDIFGRLLWGSDFRGDGFQGFEMYEKDGKLSVSLETPGVNPDDLEIIVSKDSVRIRPKRLGDAERKTVADDGRTWYSRKRVSSFACDFSLPFEIDIEKADASFENGALSISAPKLQDAESRALSISKA